MVLPIVCYSLPILKGVIAVPITADGACVAGIANAVVTVGPKRMQHMLRRSGWPRGAWRERGGIWVVGEPTCIKCVVVNMAGDFGEGTAGGCKPIDTVGGLVPEIAV